MGNAEDNRWTACVHNGRESSCSSCVISFDLMCIKCYVGRVKETLPMFATTCQALAQYVCL
jgi:hypothetical protein